MVQRAAIGRLHAFHIEAALELAALESEAHGVELHAFRSALLPGVARGNGRDVAVVRVAAEHVLVQLHPQVGQGVGRIVVVGDGARAGDGALVLVQRGAQLVVGALLPVGVARGAGCGAGARRGGQQLVELAELVVEAVGGVGAGGQGKQEGGGARQVLHVHGMWIRSKMVKPVAAQSAQPPVRVGGRRVGTCAHAVSPVDRRCRLPGAQRVRTCRTAGVQEPTLQKHHCTTGTVSFFGSSCVAAFSSGVFSLVLKSFIRSLPPRSVLNSSRRDGVSLRGQALFDWSMSAVSQ